MEKNKEIWEDINDDNIEQILETIGEEVKGLSKEEYTEEENNYYEDLFKKTKLGKSYAA